MKNSCIFENDNFRFVRTHGVGINSTPWRGLEVTSRGKAKKHVVHIELFWKGGFCPDFDGKPVTYKYSDAIVSHGMRMQGDSLKDTAEYIAVLQDAVKFAKKINAWLKKNQ